MPKVIETLRISGTVNRIFFDYGETGLTSIMLMLKGNTKIFKLPAHDRKAPFLDSIKLTKPGDQVTFTVNVERVFLTGEYENLVSWTNTTFERDKAPPPDYLD